VAATNQDRGGGIYEARSSQSYPYGIDKKRRADSSNDWNRAFALTGEKYLLHTTVTPSQARQIALKAYPGKIVSQEIEKEAGGSGLRYSFVISNKKAQHEVGVDAKTGALLENSIEGHNPD
jgi:uncharacterized membrane protein YkoI